MWLACGDTIHHETGAALTRYLAWYGDYWKGLELVLVHVCALSDSTKPVIFANVVGVMGEVEHDIAMR
jgi:hypothetical protein